MSHFSLEPYNHCSTRTKTCHTYWWIVQVFVQVLVNKKLPSPLTANNLGVNLYLLYVFWAVLLLWVNTGCSWSIFHESSCLKHEEHYKHLTFKFLNRWLCRNFCPKIIIKLNVGSFLSSGSLPMIPSSGDFIDTLYI